MRSILAYGDSLTWGADPATGSRHPRESRWPVVLEKELQGEAEVISEGLGGRTTSFDDHSGPCDRNGARALPMLLASHMPLDLVIVMLGTNDLKPAVCGRAIGAVAGMRRLVQIVRTFPYDKPGATAPQVLIVAPPVCRAGRDGRTAAGRSVAESELLAEHYRQVATDLATGYVDAGSAAVASDEDGVHLDAEQTSRLGSALAAPVRRLLV